MTDNPFASQGAAYDEGSPRGVTCPYVLTGNASEEWQDFFVAAYRFGQWASSTDISGCGPSIAMELGRDLGPEEIDGESKQCTDGITLRLTEAGWAADVWGHFCELLAALPWAHPDGDLTINNQPGDDRVVLHLWHD